ncbi:hypothetical protein [Embleya sp. MST-111070]|uniref:hypothetical protein n=1 Tax=Embleya sp. MST-111070 TaxID=3398231 RepID=UPI003F731B7E
MTLEDHERRRAQLDAEPTVPTRNPLRGELHDPAEPDRRPVDATTGAQIRPGNSILAPHGDPDPAASNSRFAPRRSGAPAKPNPMTTTTPRRWYGQDQFGDPPPPEGTPGIERSAARSTDCGWS